MRVDASKRQADYFVTRRIDIPNVDALLTQLIVHCTGIWIDRVPESQIFQFEGIPLTHPIFHIIFKVHEKRWCASTTIIIEARHLICILCHS